MPIKHKSIGKILKDLLLPEEWNDEHDVAGFESTGAITLSGDGLTVLEFRPDLDFEKIRGNQGVPTRVYRGLFGGFSLPIYNEDNEELSLDLCVPDRWDGKSDLVVHVDCWLAGAEDSKNFKLELAWEKYTPRSDTVPETANVLEVQTATGATAAAGKSFVVDFTIDHDIDTPDILVANDKLAFRLRRIAATENEVGDEIVIDHVGPIIIRDKIGGAVPA